MTCGRSIGAVPLGERRLIQSSEEGAGFDARDATAGPRAPSGRRQTLAAYALRTGESRELLSCADGDGELFGRTPDDPGRRDCPPRTDGPHSAGDRAAEGTLRRVISGDGPCRAAKRGPRSD